MTPSDRIILALDVAGEAAALAWVERVGRRVGLVKVGLELFVAAGPALVRKLRQRGIGVFLDLKLHDIPNTVAGAVRAAARCDVQMLTVHAAGGAAMLAAAAAAAPPGLTLLGVTVLTSLDAAALQELNLPSTAAERVVAWARLCQRQGLGGIVCSAQEAAVVRQASGGGVKLIVPGIRPAGSTTGDQARVATPADAIRAGADYLVLGRAVTAAADPEAALEAVTQEIASVAGGR
ncbi:MAG: orotidine-5'-phosphate decarboxylase [Acidobacteria bacterium]|nr:MAG: orotidine-5'-phosphate decarboxylase [Acidobacteriota bacterium]